MAKKVAEQINTEQSIIPTQYREAVRLSEDGTQTFVTFALPRKIVEAIRKTETIEIDTAMIAGSSRLISVFRYGLGRKMRDGALVKESIKDVSGDVIERKFSEAEKVEHAVSHAEMRREWLYGEREQQTRSGVDAETQECRRQVVAYCCNKLGMTSKSVPSEIVKAQSVADLMIAAKQASVPAKAVQALIKRGRAVAELREGDLEIDLD